MNNKLIVAIVGISLGLLALTGCTRAETAKSDSSPSADSAELTVGQSSFGSVIVDGADMAVYIFDKDTAGSGTSSCEGDCLIDWPPVIVASAPPQLTGITADVSTVTRDDGSKQVTVNGMPLYYYANDHAAGDTKGEGADGVWWLLDPAGDKMTGPTGGLGG